MDRRKTLKTKDFAPDAGIRPAQVTWCPRCRQHRGPGGRFLRPRVALRVPAAEADRVRAEIAVRVAFGPRISEGML